MAPTIRIDDTVYAWLQQQARPFEDTPNSVLRRIAKLDEAKVAPEKSTHAGTSTNPEKTAEQAYREPILRILLTHGGQASRSEVLQELEKILASQLTLFDKEAIKSGDVRWKKSAEWALHKMRRAKLVRSDGETSRGIWALTEKGEAAANNV